MKQKRDENYRAWQVRNNRATEKAKKIITTQINDTSPRIRRVPFPIDNPVMLASLGDDLIAWAQQTKSLQIEDWALSKGYSPQAAWLCKDPIFSESYQIAKYILISRMQKMNEQQEGVSWAKLQRMMRIYHAEFKADDIAKNEEQKPTLFAGAVVEDSLKMIAGTCSDE